MENQLTKTNMFQDDNKKRTIIIIATATIFVFILIALIWFVFLRSKNTQPVNTEQNTNQNFPNLDLGATGLNTYNKDNNNEIINEEESEGLDNLKHIWPKSIAGFNIVSVNIPIRTYIQSTTTDTSVNSGFNNGNIIENTQNFSIQSVIYFIDKETGNIYTAEPADYTPKRLTNTIVSGIYEAKFSNTGEYIVINKKNESGEMITQIARVPKTENSNLDFAYNLNGKIKQFDFSPDGNNLVYLKDEGVGSSIYLFNPEKGTESKILTLPIKDLNIFWKNKNSILIQTKATSKENQKSFTLNINSKMLDFLYENTDSILFSNNLTQFIVTRKNNLSYFDRPYSEDNIKNLRTLADKCVFSSSIVIYCGTPDSIAAENLPDDWYKGVAKFNDSIYKINLSNNMISEFFNVSQASGESIDIYNPKMDTNSKTFLFQNKKDLSLWLLDMVSLNSN